MTESDARRLFELVEPVALVTYMADEPTEAVMALGLRNVWDAYFAGRAAPLGRDVPAAVVHALFYNFADGEVARSVTSPVYGTRSPPRRPSQRANVDLSPHCGGSLGTWPTPPASPVLPIS
jgi:hypothetical protein